MAKFDTLKKEAAALGITIDRDKDGYWGRVDAARLELGGYDDPTTCLEDMKAAKEIGEREDEFDFEDDEDVEGAYRVTHKPSGEIFSRDTLAEAFADAKAHATTLAKPKPEPKRGGRTRRGNGSETIDAGKARAEAEDATVIEAPAPFKPSIQSETASIRSMPERTESLATLVSGIAALSVALGTLAKNLDAFVPLVGPDPSDEEDAEPEAPPPPRRRGGSKRSAA